MDVQLQPDVLRWARERAGLSQAALAKAMRVAPQRVAAWEQSGALRWTEAEALAKKSHTPYGYLFLHEPPEERLPIHDFRTVADHVIPQPSPNLLDTIYGMQRRQAWMRDFLIEEGARPLPFVGGATLDNTPHDVATDIRQALGLASGWASKQGSWDAAFRFLRNQVEAVEVLLFINGVVDNNTRRPLEVEEFRGFVLVDDYAPLIFINGKDAVTAKIFTLLHELAHIWLGIGGVSNPDPYLIAADNREPVERFCNMTAAEALVPANELDELWDVAQAEEEPFDYLARKFKVSQIVVARRALDTNLINRETFFDFYQRLHDGNHHLAQKQSSGGDFWNNQGVRLDDRFGRAVVQATRDGRLLYHDAYSLTGLKGEAFEKFARRIGYY
ncbi:MAG: ImmA/IrrE family metallo-endopeptidase [Ardenticatenales bacterium]|nr:ImmA/IrrE family metallo-endopeptidase [Ardenticatenales bacterium]